MRRAAWMEHIVPHTDLREITRRSDLCETTIDIIDEYDRVRHRWITCGEASVQMPDGRSRDLVRLTSYLGRGATDFEHDSAFAFQLPLIGWRFENAFYQKVSFIAWVPALGDPGDFAVPDPGYNPFEMEDTENCDLEHCEHLHHPIVSEGKYIPTGNDELYKRVTGRKVRVTFGPARETVDNLLGVVARIKSSKEDLEEISGRAFIHLHEIEGHGGEIENCKKGYCSDASPLLGMFPVDEAEES